MTIIIKNKETLLIDEFKFKCSIGKKGFSKSKPEGDYKTPVGIFDLGKIIVLLPFNLIIWISEDFAIEIALYDPPVTITFLSILIFCVLRDI